MVKYEYIIKTINIYIEKCSRKEPKNSSGFQPSSPLETHKNDGGLTVEDLRKIGEGVAEKFNLEISIRYDGKEDIDETNLALWDKENTTQIRLDGLIQHQDWVDFTNQGKGLYNLNEIMEYYKSMPRIMKKAVALIRFREGNNGSYCDESNRVTLSSDLFHAKQVGNERYNPQRVLYHESGHALEFKYSLLPPSRGYHFSNLPEYNERMKRNNKIFASEYSEEFYRDNMGRYDCNFEDFAETVSMVCFDRLEDKTNAQVIRLDTLGQKKMPIIEDHHSFKINHKETYEFVKDILNDRWELHARKKYDEYWEPYKASYQKLGLWE